MNFHTRITLALGLLTAISCHKYDTENWRALSEAASIMEGRHDEAYAILDSLDRSGMNRREAARHSLLVSMALDKKYVDLTTDSLIAPAVKYYRHHGSPDERLKTVFYHARIMENAGDKDAALERLISGEQYIRKAKDHLFVGRYYSKKNHLYSNRYEWEKALKAAQSAEYHCRLVNDTRGLATALLVESSAWQILDKPDSASYCLSGIKEIWEMIDDHRKGQYYRQSIIYNLHDKVTAECIYNECIFENIKSTELPFDAFTDLFIQLEEPEKANENLSLAVQHGCLIMDSKEYLLRKYKIYALSDDYYNAFESASKYYTKLEQYEHTVLTSDARFLEERVSAARKEERDKYRIIMLSIAACMASALLVLTYIRLRKRQDRLSQALIDAEEEKKQLEELMKNGALISKEALEMITSRINLLNDIIISRMTGGKRISRLSAEDIESVSKDKENFLMNLVMMFSISHPAFIQTLRGKELTDWEVGYCCLYLMGLNGKDICGFVLGNNSYNISSEIRQKLGIRQSDGTLKTYLKSISEQGR